jgi:AcrR family transcriptional regulator
MARESSSEGGATSRLERSQAARRAQVLAAVLELLREGGYDGVRVRDVWSRTGVGTDTIYRYFGSRERMIAEALAAWLDEAFARAAASRRRTATPAEKLLSTCREVWDVWERNPELLEPFLRAALADPKDKKGLAKRSLRGVVPSMSSALDGVDPEYARDLLLIVESVSHAASAKVIGGQLAVGDVYPILERTIRRLSQHPAMDGHRPAGWHYGPRGD